MDSVFNMSIDEPLQAAEFEYSGDVLAYGKLLESKGPRISEGNFCKGYVEPRMRAMLLDWLIQVQVSIHLLLGTTMFEEFDPAHLHINIWYALQLKL